MSKDLFKLKREFLEYCELEKGQSFLTIENYDRYLTRFLAWLKTEKSETLNSKSQTNSNDQNPNDQKKQALQADSYKLKATDIDQEIVRKYRLYVNRLNGPDGRELKASTQNHHILALRAFLRYLSFSGEKTISPDKLTLAKTGDREVSFLSKEEYQRFLNAPDTSTLNGLRDKALIELLFSTGLRVSELCSLKLGQINFETGEFAVIGKGKKMRVVFLSQTALQFLAEYLVKRGVLINQKSRANDCHSRPDRESTIMDPRVKPEDDSPRNYKPETSNDPKAPDTLYVISDTDKDLPLFVSNRNRMMNVRAVERLVQKYAKIAGISKVVTPHTLRHTFATDLLSAGADIRSVQSLLGHSNISTTQVYTHVTDRHLREIHSKYHDQQRNNTDDNAEKTQTGPKKQHRR